LANKILLCLSEKSFILFLSSNHIVFSLLFHLKMKITTYTCNIDVGHVGQTDEKWIIVDTEKKSDKNKVEVHCLDSKVKTPSIFSKGNEESQKHLKKMSSSLLFWQLEQETIESQHLDVGLLVDEKVIYGTLFLTNYQIYFQDKNVKPKFLQTSEKFQKVLNFKFFKILF
jgi:hypothetical protein